MDLGLDLGLGGQALRANEIETEVEIEGLGSCGPIPSANPSPVGSPFPRKGPTAVSIARFGVESLGFQLRRSR